MLEECGCGGGYQMGTARTRGPLYVKYQGDLMRFDWDNAHVRFTETAFIYQV